MNIFEKVGLMVFILGCVALLRNESDWVVCLLIIVGWTAFLVGDKIERK